MSPALKSFGVPGRPRLFEVEQRVKTINNARKKYILGHRIKKKKVFMQSKRNH